MCGSTVDFDGTLFHSLHKVIGCRHLYTIQISHSTITFIIYQYMYKPDGNLYYYGSMEKNNVKIMFCFIIYFKYFCPLCIVFHVLNMCYFNHLYRLKNVIIDNLRRSTCHITIKRWKLLFLLNPSSVSCCKLETASFSFHWNGFSRILFPSFWRWCSVDVLTGSHLSTYDWIAVSVIGLARYNAQP